MSNEQHARIAANKHLAPVLRKRLSKIGSRAAEIVAALTDEEILEQYLAHQDGRAFVSNIRIRNIAVAEGYASENLSAAEEFCRVGQ
ncbi:MAG TPA: hypothetical protein VNV41_16390 [Candidatus Acidoferrales bacterium]|jgi:hypothetical protein|nr:hypothetical protein [Candidatus Acidoferrales bacterium]